MQEEQLKKKKRKRIIVSWFPASKKETTSPGDWILDRNSPWVLQHRQFQLPDGDHRWFEHITDISSEENGKSHVINIKLIKKYKYKNYITSLNFFEH